MLKVQLNEMSPCEKRLDIGGKRCPNWETCYGLKMACAKFQHYLNHGLDNELDLISGTPNHKRYAECYPLKDVD